MSQSGHMLPCKARQVLRDEEKAVWTASGPETGTRYAALFNLSDAPAWVGASWEELSLPAAHRGPPIIAIYFRSILRNGRQVKGGGEKFKVW